MAGNSAQRATRYGSAFVSTIDAATSGVRCDESASQDVSRETLRLFA